MASDNQFDSRELSLALPYVPNLGLLQERPVFTDGQDTCVSWGGTLQKRPGTIAITGSTLTFQCFRLWVYETLEASPVVFIVGSFFTGSLYELRYMRLDTADSWHTPTERRGCNHSSTPHEGIVRRGKLYIKGTPSAGNDASKLGSIYLDGTGGTMVTHDWGSLGPTAPVALSNPSGWSASAHPVSVLNSWIYVYTWVKVSGQETNHSPLQTNPDSSPSATGPFSNKLPNMVITGPSDTTEYPFVNLYRTTDGGGTFYFVHQFANTGGNITVQDKYLASGSGNADPIPDTQLDTSHVAPGTQTNSPPPTVAPPLVTGTDPIQESTRIVEYAGRLWYGINEYLFYSALEELNEGVPEECWPSGIALPNFFRMPEGIAQLMKSPDGLVCCTRRETIRVQGTTKATFNPRPFLALIGALGNFQNQSGVEAGENIVWMTQDHRLVVVHGDQYAVLSNPLGLHLQTNSYQFVLKFWPQNDREYLLLEMVHQTTPSLSHVHVYDMQRSRLTQDDFWFPPWSIKGSVVTVGQFSTTATDNKTIFSLWDGTHSVLAYLDQTGVTATDANPAGGVSNFGYTFTTSLLPVPLGDHVNQLREPGLSPVASQMEYTRTLFNGDADPTVSVYYDDFFTAPVTLNYPGDAPARRNQSQGYRTVVHNDLRQTCKHMAFKFTGGASAVQAEFHHYAPLWVPDKGAR